MLREKKNVYNYLDQTEVCGHRIMMVLRARTNDGKYEMRYTFHLYTCRGIIASKLSIKNL